MTISTLKDYKIEKFYYNEDETYERVLTFNQGFSKDDKVTFNDDVNFADEMSD